MKFSIFTKNECIFCKKSKEYLDFLGEEYEEYDISNPEILQYLLSIHPKATAVPQIWYGNKYVGSYNELINQF